MTDAWRTVAATLADEARRLLWARMLAEGGVDVGPLPSRERRALAALERAGLARVEGAGGAARAVALDAFSPLLAHRPAASGIDRFVRDGRIASWPRRPSDRAALLAWAAERALPEGGAVDERAVTERLAAIADDPATLRRDLVDAGLLDRDADGAAYRRAPRD
ncbi:DUF2087 domain-containing protein [Agrococcus sp. SL85]|uniref:DUF2087 domain-containing protein n=1 Tax=Agrococcus sp. SL85 TaxID=2995141 RepID=UPI00226CA102|nr:DUF2087 domain-containing protein [Agrococcus sp. SL85]WAC66926.1 DUF2087 domain-containing protein [Agrococcus sp. SL85]